MTDKTSDTPIDAVIAWVNGHDKHWQDKINKHTKNKINFDDKDQMVRFNSVGEIEIAVKSIIKFAPFMRSIFIMTDNQFPESFDTLEKLAKEKEINLEIIDHKTIFKGYEEYLPTFNSMSIENMMFKIPNLSEHFVYFNDDFFLMRETKPTDFFIDGKPIIRGKWETFYEERTFTNHWYTFLALIGKPKKKNANSPRFKKAQQIAARLAGTKKYVRRFHTPASMKKSSLVEFFEKNDDILRENIKHRFRHKTQFVITSLSEHLEIMKETYHFQTNTQLTYFRRYKHIYLVKANLSKFINNKEKIFVCCQSLELANHEMQSYILKWLYNRLN